MSLTRAKAISAASSRRDSASTSCAPKQRATRPSVSARLARRAGLVAKRGSRASSGRSSTLAQNATHSRSFWMEMRIGTSSAVSNTP